MKVYLDNAATTRMDPDVVSFIRPFFEDVFGNPASIHCYGREAMKHVEEARSNLANCINASENEIVFTSGGTESDNLAILGIARSLKHKGKHIITSKIEHPAVLEACKQLEKEGYNVTYLPVSRDGVVNVDRLNETIRKETILVSIMHVNNETGSIQPIEEIGKVCRDNDVLFHTDAVQSFGKLNIDVKRMNIDLLSASAHKFHGPKGIGMLYVRDGLYLHPIMYGGHHEMGLRPGTLNVPGILGMMKAAEIAYKELDKTHAHIKRLSKKVVDGILGSIPESYLNSPSPTDVDEGRDNRYTRWYPGVVNIRFSFIEGESLMLLLDKEGIACSTGSACASGSLEPSHVLLAMGLRPEQAHGSLRFSMSRFTSIDEIDYLLEKLPACVERLRKISPFKNAEALDRFIRKHHQRYKT